MSAKRFPLSMLALVYMLAVVGCVNPYIRALRDLNVKGQGKKRPWIQIMATRKRLTFVVCRTCHMDIHTGQPLTQHASTA